MSTTTTKQVPKKAMQFDAPLQFAEVEKKDGDDLSLFPISMLGRSAQPIYHWYWGKVVHDMAGFSTNHPTVAIDYRHDDDEPLGYLDQFRADNSGLHVNGNLISLDWSDPKDRVVKLKRLSGGGVPFQASIFFDTWKLEEVLPGASAEVNGYSIDGPAIIIRQWSLRGMAVCLYGADGRTHSKFSDSDSDVEVPVPCFFTEPIMTKKTLTSAAAKKAAAKKLSTTPPKNGKQPPAGAAKFAGKGKQADESEDDDELADDDEDEDEELAEDDETDSETEEETEDDETESDEETEGKAKKHSAKSGKSSGSKSRNELKKYIEAFGHKNGAEWFADDLDFTSAMGKHCKELSAALSAKDAEIAELQKKLKAVNRGETQPLKLSQDKEEAGKGSKETPKQFSHLGDAIGGFAASIKLPTPSRN